MSTEDRIRKAMRAADQIAPAGEGWDRIQRKIAHRRQRRRVERLLVVILAVSVVAGGTLLGVRTLGDSEEPAVVLAEPSGLSPSSTATGSPSAPGTPLATVSTSPSQDADSEGTYVSRDGTWEMKYPAGWEVDDDPGNPNEWRLFQPNPDLPPAETHLRDGEYLVEFAIRQNEESASIDDLLKSYCRIPSGVEGTVEECRKVEIKGRTWAWARLHLDISGGVRNYVVGTIVGGNVYQAGGGAPDGSRQEEGLREVREILNSFVIRE